MWKSGLNASKNSIYISTCSVNKMLKTMLTVDNLPVIKDSFFSTFSKIKTLVEMWINFV
jgi:hypothetical protein